MPPETNSPPALLLMPTDDVMIACRDIEAGTLLGGPEKQVVTRHKIPSGHKVAFGHIPKGAPVRKFGQVIGFASADITAGSHVHSHNLEAGSFEREYHFGEDARPLARMETERHFDGYDRGDGRYGTRNYIAIISSVNCSASASK